MAVGLEEEARSDRPVSRDELALVVSDVLRPLAQRLSAYQATTEFRDLRLRNRLALRRHAAGLGHRIETAEEWCDG